MFKNPGGKIKALVKFAFTIEVVITIIVLLLLIVTGYLKGAPAAIAFLVLFVVVFFEWVSAVAIYAFGELVENSSIMAKNIEHLTALGYEQKNSGKEEENLV